MHVSQSQAVGTQRQVDLSIVIPTYNESANILKLIEAVRQSIPSNTFAEIIIVDDNSPDGTGRIVESYIRNHMNNWQGDRNRHEPNRSVVRIIHRKYRSGLISAIVDGIKQSQGESILVMDADFSHPPEMIPKMMEELNSKYDLVIASRYMKGGSVIGWPFKRRIISKGANKIAIHSLRINGIKDVMSGFFLFKRHIIKNITFDTSGYKILLEMLVKADDVRVKEIPYVFTNRKSGESKLDTSVMFDYLRSIWRLYRYGQKSRRGRLIEERRKSVLFLSKAARFYTVGASGLLVNYLVSFLLSNGMLSSFFYLHATTIGIILSITSNFILNKAWTFEDRDFSVKHTLKQYGLYGGFSSIGAVIQLSLLYIFVQSYGIEYALSLLIAVAIASIGNFLFNKKWTFGEKIWG